MFAAEMRFKRHLPFVILLSTCAAIVGIWRFYLRPAHYDLLIINARVVDGTGAPQFRAAVGVRGGRIVHVGGVGPSDSAGVVIDAGGRVVAPGFIDIHTHAESIYGSPDAENFVHMGVTTVVTGNCGSSEVNVARFFEEINHRPLAVNIATFIGHNSVRALVMGTDDRAPTTEEMRRMESLVERAMRDGAMGLSTGLIYTPGAYARTDEIVALARVAQRHGGIYTTHIRDEGAGVFEAIREAIQVGEEARIPVEVSHLKISSKKLWGGSAQALGLIEEARARGVAVSVDAYAYAASSTSLDVLLPEWVRAGGREEAEKRLEDGATRERVLREMLERLDENGFEDFSHAVVANFQASPSYNGKSIAEITREERGGATPSQQAEQVLEMYLRGGASMVYHRMSEDDVRQIIRSPLVSIASDSGIQSADDGVPHPRCYGNNARVLGYYARDLRLMPLEEAVRKMTYMPARVLGMRDRGLIREGYAADLVVFDDAAVSDRATYEQPRQYPSGIAYVVVNGLVVLADGRMTAARPGRALRRSSGGLWGWLN
jgi:N-acyl-D-amino-acid deacylase